MSSGHVGGHVDGETLLIGQRGSDGRRATLWLPRSLVCKQIRDGQLARRRWWRHAGHVAWWRWRRQVFVIGRGGAAAPRVIMAADRVIPLPVVRPRLTVDGCGADGLGERWWPVRRRDAVLLPAASAAFSQVSLKLLRADIQPVSQLTYRRLLLQYIVNLMWRQTVKQLFTSGSRQ